MGSLTLPAKATRREWIGLAVIALPCVVYAMDLTVLNLAVPKLSEDLQPSNCATALDRRHLRLLCRRVPDHHGDAGRPDRGAAGLADRRRRLRAHVDPGCVLHECGDADRRAGPAWVSAATLAPSTLSLIRNMFEDPKQRTFAIGVWVTSFSAGAAIGPLVGGALLETFWWGSVFLAAVPIMALLLAVGPRLLPEYRDPEARGLDLLSARHALARCRAGGHLWTEGDRPGRLRTDCGNLDHAWARLRYQGVRASPAGARRSVDRPEALPAARVQRGAGDEHLGFFVEFGIAVLIAQYLQLVLGLSPLEAGLWTVPSAAGFIVGSMLTPLLVRWIQPGFAIACGLALAAAGFILLTQVAADSGLGVTVTASVLFSLGLAPVFTLAADLMVGQPRPGGLGPQRGSPRRAPEFGGALGIAVLGSVGTAVYRGEVDDSLSAALPPEPGGGRARHARRRRGSRRGPPAPVGADLIEVAREAFTQALQVATTVSAALVLAAAAIAVAVFHRARGAQTGGPDEATPRRSYRGAGGSLRSSRRGGGIDRMSETVRTPNVEVRRQGGSWCPRSGSPMGRHSVTRSERCR